MRVVDASAWIEWLTGSPTGRRLGDKLPAKAAWLVPTIVQHELAKWLTREAGEDQAEAAIALSKACVIADLTSDIALSAASISLRHKLATADAIIYATALAFGAELITCDKHFQGLPNVSYITKVHSDLN